MNSLVLMWIIFGIAVTVMLAIDLRVFHKRAHEVRLKEAVIWSVVWIAAALLFAAGIAAQLGTVDAMTFLTGYVIEKALSMDNLFVFLIIFSYFGVPKEYQHKVLFWGILGALVFRALFIAAGVTLIASLHWMVYVLGGFLVYTGFKLLRAESVEVEPERNVVLRIFRKRFPVSDSYDGDRFFSVRNGRILATPLFITLLVVETTDVVFATDSIPAILGISLDPFIVYTSNIFAILGLRALYFVLSGVMGMFRYLHYGLAVILAFVGVKMLLSGLFDMAVSLELGIVVLILGVSIAASVLIPEK